MAITDRDRKILWGLSGNSCAKCGAELVREPSIEGDPHAVVGEECHIVARSPDGPRGDAASIGDDTYSNLILLCASCHAEVDDQPARFTVEVLRSMKAKHEQPVAERLAGSTTWSVKGGDRPVKLDLLENGDQVVRLVTESHQSTFDRPDGLTSAERAAVGSFLQDCRDWGDILGDLGPEAEMQAADGFEHHLNELMNMGFVVLGAKRRLTLVTGKSDESPWIDSAVKVMRAEDFIEATLSAAASSS